MRTRPTTSSKAAGSTRRSAVSGSWSRRALAMHAESSSSSTDAARVTTAENSSPT
ncbi:hypothetical protein [Micromonospora sp. DT47]|uniref:hypothetical protein n=1 Tax=Micromonospora sp. DT47 TaxID=3393431 RepID=UPI003CF93241